jgi:AbiV family abortive infection protein
VDLRAIKAAGRTELAAFAFAVARNAQGLFRDAEALAGLGSTARAYSLAALAVEECGKAGSLSALAVLPERLRTRAPVGRMLEWHQLKHVEGLLIAVVTFEAPGLSSRLALMPATDATQILSDAWAPADEADRLKRGGLYVDMDGTGRIREPSDISEADLATQLARARLATASTAALLGPDAKARFVNPPPEAIELASAVVSVLTRAGSARTPEAATDVMLNAVIKFRDGSTLSTLTR